MAEKTLMKLGFTNDEQNMKLNEVFKDNVKFPEKEFDVIISNPPYTYSCFSA